LGNIKKNSSGHQAEIKQTFSDKKFFFPNAQKFFVGEKKSIKTTSSPQNGAIDFLRKGFSPKLTWNKCGIRTGLNVPLVVIGQP
jgi:hypothetical protein